MITDDEAEKIILSAFHYVVALQEQIQTYLNFQINHYLYNEFKVSPFLSSFYTVVTVTIIMNLTSFLFQRNYKDNLATFPRIVSGDTDWSALIPADTTIDDNIRDIEKKIKEIKGSLVDVQRMGEVF